jgi:hypothetical protein
MLEISYNLYPAEALDSFALLASQSYNYGNKGDWFWYFRRGMTGFYARIYGTQVHYNHVHAWMPMRRDLTETEYHIASFFFCAQSALECFIFAINALGNAMSVKKFVDCSNDKSLESVSLTNILGSRNDKQPPHKGYRVHFPQLQICFMHQRVLIRTIEDNYGVSKHTQATYTSGKQREDPPLGFFEQMNLDHKSEMHSLFCPMAEILLMAAPRVHYSRQPDFTPEMYPTLEHLGSDYVNLVQEAVKFAVADAEKNIPLNVTELR